MIKHYFIIPNYLPIQPHNTAATIGNKNKQKPTIETLFSMMWKKLNAPIYPKATSDVASNSVQLLEDNKNELAPLQIEFGPKLLNLNPHLERFLVLPWVTWQPSSIARYLLSQRRLLWKSTRSVKKSTVLNQFRKSINWNGRTGEVKTQLQGENIQGQFLC